MAVPAANIPSPTGETHRLPLDAEDLDISHDPPVPPAQSKDKWLPQSTHESLPDANGEHLLHDCRVVTLVHFRIITQSVYRAYAPRPDTGTSTQKSGNPSAGEAPVDPDNPQGSEGLTERPRCGVWQDKAREGRAREASLRPAAGKQITRSQKKNINVVHACRSSSPSGRLRQAASSSSNRAAARLTWVDGKNCNPVLLLIDEAGRTAIPSLADHATTVVGRGISLWIAVQSLSQLDAVYGKVRASVMRDNMESQIYYRPSNQQTADYLEHCLGKISRYAHSQTSREGTHTSLGLTEQPVPLMTAQAIKQLKDEEIIGFHRRLPAFRARRMDWRRFPNFVQRRNIPAPQLPLLPPLEDVPWQGIGQPVSQYIDPDMM